MNHLADLSKPNSPVTVLQYGEGNFLRAFVDEMLDQAIEQNLFHGTITIVQPIRGTVNPAFYNQNCNYTVLLRGRENGKDSASSRVIRSVSNILNCYSDYEAYSQLAHCETLKFVVSNTTEAGIVYRPEDRLQDNPPESFPGKVTKFLWERYEAFHGDPDKGLIFLPVELIEQNGSTLLQCVEKLAGLWKLPDEFLDWVHSSCLFCNTLVDRIVTGYPKDEAEALYEQLGYQDPLLDVGERFALWVIQSEDTDLLRRVLPLEQAGMPVIFTDDLSPYRQRKVKILNGAHTGTVLAAALAGLKTVGECMSDQQFRPYLEHLIYQEVAPTVPLPEEEVLSFAAQVMERFENPYLKHYLTSIAMNSVSKWKTRNLPSLKGYLQLTGKLPDYLSFSLAALLAYYTSSDVTPQDNGEVLEFFQSHQSDSAEELVHSALANVSFWGEDLNTLPQLTETVAAFLAEIRSCGARAAVKHLLEEHP